MRIYNHEELKDSRIFFDKRPPKYMAIFIVFITICLIGALVASIYVPKSYIINASGIATTDDNRYISVNINGEISEVIKKEGDFVNKGDVLFILSDGKDNSQTKAIQPQIDNLKERINALNKYESSLLNKANYLNNSGVEQAYYGKMEMYLSSLNGESYSKNNERSSLNELQSKLDNLIKEKDSLNGQLGAVSDEIKKEEIKTKIEAKTAEIEAKQSEIKQANTSLNNPSSQATQIFQQLLSELGSERNTTTLQLSQLEGQLETIKDENNLKEIKAENDGYLHYLTTFKSGVSLQMNQTVAEISTNESENYVVEANVLAKDISKVNVGQDVSIELQGVNSQKFGTLKGKVEKISSGTMIEQSSQGNIIYYQCIISLDSTILKPSKNETISMVKSMPVQARIIYDKETYFEWLKELINLKN